MGKNTVFIALALSIFLSSCKEEITIKDLQRFAATESYPEDRFLDTISVKRALIIVAHDDDDCAMSGTIAKLSKKGWDIKEVSLTNHVIEGSSEVPASIICRGNEILVKDGLYRLGLDTIKYPYLPIPYEEIKQQFLTEKVSKEIVKHVEAFKPSVLFTLDNVKGGYGHPEHIFMSQLVKDLFDTRVLNVDRIYQSVYTDHMETEILDNWLEPQMKKWGYPSASKLANELYGIKGMPDPTTQITINDVAETKMKYLLSYEESAKLNIRKFIPYYEEFDAKTYFGIFDREFFRVIEKPVTTK